MAKIGRPGLSREKRVELWERWKIGQCLSDIVRSLERTKGASHNVGVQWRHRAGSSPAQPGGVDVSLTLSQ